MNPQSVCSTAVESLPGASLKFSSLVKGDKIDSVVFPTATLILEKKLKKKKRMCVCKSQKIKPEPRTL